MFKPDCWTLCGFDFLLKLFQWSGVNGISKKKTNGFQCILGTSHSIICIINNSRRKTAMTVHFTSFH